jgi:hypothetical protein
MRVAPSFRTPAALQATPPSAAEAPNSFVLRHLCAVPLESAICLPLEDEGKVTTVFNYGLYMLVILEFYFLGFR